MDLDKLADDLMGLINSKPWSPTKAEIVEVLRKHSYAGLHYETEVGQPVNLNLQEIADGAAGKVPWLNQKKCAEYMAQRCADCNEALGTGHRWYCPKLAPSAAFVEQARKCVPGQPVNINLDVPSYEHLCTTHVESEEF